MRTLHFALTPLAGSPIRIVNALNRCKVSISRLVTLDPFRYGTRTFIGDLAWNEDRELVIELLEAAEIVVLHHYFDLKYNPFEINFGYYLSRGTRVVRQFHTAPKTIAKQYGISLNSIMDDKLPQLVVAQFHERYYPRARLVPLILPIREVPYRPLPAERLNYKIFYAPTFRTSAWASRWDTKGYPETMALLRKLSRSIAGLELDVCMDRPHFECLERRRSSIMAIDEMVTGSFHTSSLESLSQGLPTFAYLDARTSLTLEILTGTQEIPWMNFRLEDAERPLRALLEDRALREEIGARSRTWIEQHYCDDQLILHYKRAFRDLLEAPETFNTPRFDENDLRSLWFVRNACDAEWRLRRSRAAWSSRMRAWIERGMALFSAARHRMLIRLRVILNGSFSAKQEVHHVLLKANSDLPSDERPPGGRHSR